MVWDAALAVYIALGVLYMMYHDDRSGEPEGATLMAVVVALLVAIEVAVLVNALLDGAGPRITKLTLVRADGRPATSWDRLRRVAVLHLVGLIVLQVAGIVGGLLVTYTAAGEWFGSLMGLARVGVIGAWLLMAGIVYTLLSAVAHRSGRPWHDRLAGTHFESRIGRAAETRVLPWYRQSVWWIAIGTIGLTYWVGWQIAEIDLKEIVQGLTSVGPLASALVQPEFSILEDCAWAMVETVYLALMATTFAVPVAVVLSFLGARNIMPRTVIGTSVYFVMRTIFTVVRSIEPIVWAIIFVVWVGLSPFAGMLALMVHSIAALGKLYSEQVENIDQGPVEAIRATGAGAVHTVVYAVWPQVVPPFVAFTLYRWDINVRMATIVGMVGGGGIGALLLQYQGMARWNEVALIAWMITMVVWLMDISSARIRERMI
jgi:phosphonate transport system permease protein